LHDGVRLETTPKSVAGRGVFANAPLSEGDVAVAIPEHCVFIEKNLSPMFPKLSAKLKRRRKRFLWFGRILRSKDDYDELVDNLWQAELTAFASASKDADHPWGEWIGQWKRDDATHDMFKRKISWKNDQEIKNTATELNRFLPRVSFNYVEAALKMRLKRYHDLKTIYKLDDSSSTADIYSTLCSRSVQLGENIVGIIPMFDMVNHSPRPNLALCFDGEEFTLFCTRDIQQGEELFIKYTSNDKDPNDEINELWNLIQWGF